MIIFDTKADVHLVKEEISCPKISVISVFFIVWLFILLIYTRSFFFYYELITDFVFIYHFDTMHFFMEGHARTFMSLFSLNQLIRKVKSVSFD